MKPKRRCLTFVLLSCLALPALAATPDYQARGQSGPPADSLQGWKAPNCEVVVQDGIITICAKGTTPFQGVAAGKFSAATAVKFRARSVTGGAGKIEWLPASTFPAQAKSVPFPFTGGDWQALTVELPASGPLGVVRLYLPADKQSVQLDWVELKMAGGKSQHWDS